MALEASSHNRMLNHIALHVSDLEAAITWYTTIFGFTLFYTLTYYDHSIFPMPPSSVSTTLDSLK
jgi:catechol 2,3-dioxygenase-like lactoylglutathione lyase family enzyme